jgi:hypothetical protein
VIHEAVSSQSLGAGYIAPNNLGSSAFARFPAEHKMAAFDVPSTVDALAKECVATEGAAAVESLLALLQQEGISTCFRAHCDTVLISEQNRDSFGVSPVDVGENISDVCSIQWHDSLFKGAGLNEAWNHEKKSGVQIVEGVLQLKQLRNSASITHKVRGTALRAISRPSYYLLKKYELRNELSELDGFVKIHIDAETVRVIPRASRDNEPLWVCAEDLATCIQFIKKLGISTSHADEDLPKGIRRRKRKSGERFTVDIIENDTRKIHTVKSLQEAIDLQQRHSIV